MKNYQLKYIKILFISEAPSSSDEHFYRANTILYKTIKNAFEESFGLFESDVSFLKFFKSFGCYLDYLCIKPIDKTSAINRAVSRQHCIASLAERIKLYKPETIVVLMKAIAGEVREAITISGIKSVKHVELLSFPSVSERNRLDCISSIKRL